MNELGGMGDRLERNNENEDDTRNGTCSLQSKAPQMEWTLLKYSCPEAKKSVNRYGRPRLKGGVLKQEK